MERYLKHFALVIGVILLAASMIFSFRGFEFNFQTDDGMWSTIFWIIGLSLTAAVSVLQMVFNSDYKNLNLTLKLFGVLSYVYSIYTNRDGLSDFVSMSGSQVMTWIIAGGMDMVPEPLITWAMGDALKGDFLGNILKWVFPSVSQQDARSYPKSGKTYPAHQQQKNPQYQGQHQKPVFEAISRLPKRQSQESPKFITPIDDEFHPVNYDA